MIKNCRRYANILISLILILLGVASYFKPVLRSDPIIILCSMIWTSLILINFQKLVTATHDTPVYFRDLILPETEMNRNIYQYHFVLLMVVSMTIAVGVICDYALYQRRQKTPDSAPEIASFCGGIIALLSSARYYSGRVLLFFLSRRKKRTIIQIQSV